MKANAKPLLITAILFAIVQIVACTKQSNHSILKTSRPIKLQSDSDSSYIAHVKIDSNHTDTLRYFTIYTYLTTKHGTTRLTVPGNFSVTMTGFAGTPLQYTGPVTILSGHNYGSSSFSVRSIYTYPLTLTNLTPSPSSFGGIPITARKDNGIFTP